MGKKKLEQISKEDLIKGRWYSGEGRNNDVAYWNGEYFLTIGFKFNEFVVKYEGYYGKTSGCFKPLKLIESKCKNY